MEPQSARVLSEIGRAWYRLDDDPKAVAALDLAVTFNPHYLPAWQYLLRMLSVNRDPSGPSRARQSTAIFPNCYPLALLGIAAHPAAEAIGMILKLLSQLAPRWDGNARLAALAPFREAILAAMKADAGGSDLIPLLRVACEVFPESARLASEFGTALHSAGQQREGWEQHARAMALRNLANISIAEFPHDRNVPLPWQIADHIRKASDF
jgi:hypothetical protein